MNSFENPDTKKQEVIDRVMSRKAAPSLSPVAVRLVELAADDKASAQDLAEVIEMDPGMAARLLSMVNSPVYRTGSGEVTSITRAVVLMGLREVRITALSISLRDTLPIKKTGPDYTQFWRASLHRAALARETARRMALPTIEEAFLAGLMQELGLPILLKALEDDELAGFPGIGASLKSQMQWERQNLGLDHRELGRIVMGKWGLPSFLVACQDVLPADQKGGARLLEAADFARRATEAFFQPEGIFTDIYKVAKRRFAFEPETVNKILASALSFVGDAAEALEIELDHQADLLEVMEKANNALSRLSTEVEPHLLRMSAPSRPPSRHPDPGKVRNDAVVDTLEAVVHEIRNPLMSVGGFARRLADQMEGRGRAGKYAKVIMSEAARLDSVLSEMISMVSPYTPRPEPVDLADLLSALGGDLSAGPGGMQLHLPGAKVAVSADPEGMRECLRALVEYGYHLLSPESGPLHAHLGVKQDEAVVSIFGKGSTSPPAEDELAGKHFGPELAMAKARRILEAHGGRLTVEQAPGASGFVISARISARA